MSSARIKEVRFGDLFKAVKGKKPKILQDDNVDNFVPYVDIKAFEKGEIRRYADVDSSRLVNESDVIIVWDGARSGLVGTGSKGALGSTLGKFEVDEKYIESKYLYYFLRSKFHLLNTNTKGSGIPHLNPDYMYELAFPLVSKLDQVSVVEKLDKVFVKLDVAKNNLDKVEKKIKHLKSVIASSICAGVMTEGWRESNQNIETGDVLYQKIQDKITSEYEKKCQEAKEKGERKPKDQRKNKKSSKEDIFDYELPETWKKVRLEDVTYLVTDGTHHTPKYVDEGVPFLSVKNVRPFYFRDSDKKFITPEEHEKISKRCPVEIDDILYTKVGATYGYAARNILDYDYSIFVSVALIKPVKEFLLPEYLELVMNSEMVFKQARHRVSGSGVPDLHLIEIRDFRIPLPPVEEQKLIVDQAVNMFHSVDIVTSTFEDLYKRYQLLERTLLKSAFAGELTDSSGCSVDELLKEIEQLRLSKKAKKKKTAKKKVTKKKIAKKKVRKKNS